LFDCLPVMSAQRRLIGLFVSLLVLAFSPARAETLVDDAGRFVVDIPQPVTRSSTESGSAAAKLTNFVLTHDSGPTAELVQYTDFLPGRLAQIDHAKMYESAANGGAANVNGVIRSLVVHRLGTVEGREMIVDFKASEAKCVSRCRFYLANDRLYALIYVGPAGSEDSTEAVHFLDSFRLLR
jgi:hypothetical protein